MTTAKHSISARLRYLFLTACILLAFGEQLCAQPDRQTVGLVLSGGGAKGIAHIGVIQALEENNIPIDYITGTSMGAIIGGLYASGYTPEEMLQLVMSRQVAYWSSGKIDPNLTYHFNKPTPSPSMFSTDISLTTASDDSIASSLISGLPMSFAFVELFSSYTAACGGDFDKLFVPYRCVASDIELRRKHVFSQGDLGEAIRASMSFPIVFQPISIDGKIYYDGGIYDNFPVSVMREDFNPSIMIGVNVSLAEDTPATSLMAQISKLVIQAPDDTIPDNEGIEIGLNLQRYSLLDFDRAREIYKIGYEQTMASMDSIKSRIYSRTPNTQRSKRRAEYKAALPPLRFDRVEVSGGNNMQNDYIEDLFKPRLGSDTIGIDRTRDAYYRAISLGKLRSLYPKAIYNDTTGLFTLKLKASVKDGLKGSIGGYITSSTNSFLYASAGYSTLSFSRIGTNIETWIGSSQMAGVFNGRIHLSGGLPSAFATTIVVSREKFYSSDHIFFDDKLPSSIVNNEYFGRLSWSFAASRHSTADIGLGYGHLSYKYDLIESDGNEVHKSTDKLWQAFLKYSASTLDHINFPLAGHSISASAMGLIGNNRTDCPVSHSIEKTHPKWIQLEFASRHYPELSKHFTLGIETNLMLSTRKLLHTYSASLASAPAYCPTPASTNVFRAGLRAHNYAALGLIPVYKNGSLSARLGGYFFMPLRKIVQTADNLAEHGKWLRNPEFFSEADITYHFPFGSLTAYTNYTTSQGSQWNVGISFGIHILPPKFLR